MKDACATRTELLMQYSTAVTRYSQLLVQVHDQLGVIPLIEYQHLRKAAESARLIADHARTLFEDHILTHGC